MAGRPTKGVSSKRKDVASGNDSAAAKRIRTEDHSAMQVPDRVDAFDPVPGDTDRPQFLPGFSPADSGEFNQSRSDNEDVDIPPEEADAVYTPRQQAAIVQFWEDNPMYWDKADPNFKGTGGIKKRLLNEQAEKMGTTAQEINDWVRNQRTMYGRLRKAQTHRASGAAAAKPLTARQNWVLRSFKFLDSHIHVRTQSFQFGRVSNFFPFV